MTPDDRETADLRDLLARRAEVREAEVDELRSFIGRLPARGRRRRGIGLLAAAAGVTVMLGVGFVAAFNLSGGTTGAAPSAPNPAAFAYDPRLAVCHATADDAVAIFELEQLSDYPAQLPHAYPLLGLQADPTAPALVIVFKGPGTPQRAGDSPASGSHDLCLVVGADAAHWQQIAVVDVDTTGLEAYLPVPTGTPIASTFAPWADRCGGVSAGINRVLQLPHGTDAMTLSSVAVPISLMTADPMTIVVYDAGHPFAPMGTPPAAGVSFAPRQPGYQDLCILVGSDAATAKRTIVEVGTADAPQPSGAATSPPSASVPPVSPSSILRPQISAADCVALRFSEGRCLAVVEQARASAGLDWAQITAARLAMPKPDPRLGDGVPVADVTFTLLDGTTVAAAARCLTLGSQHDAACTDHPEIRLSMPIAGYYDVPCGAVPGGEPGSACATPLPTVNPKAVSAPLRIASQDIPLTTGHQEVLVGQATLPNGIMKDARFSLADPTTQAFTVNGAVTLVIRSTDPSRPPFDNAYAHGWHPGSEVVNVSIVLDVVSVQPGATLQIRNLNVR